MRITVTYQLVWNLEWPGRWVSGHACGGIILITLIDMEDLHTVGGTLVGSWVV